MKTEPKIIAEEIHLLKIEIVHHKMDITVFKKANKPKIGIGHKVMHNLKDERIKIELAITFTDHKDQELMEMQIDFHYHIEHLENFYQLNEENNPIFYRWMIATLLGIAVSTSRGIIYQKLQSNDIHNVLIPVISPQSLLKPNTKSS